jgi:hypothetical protein
MLILQSNVSLALYASPLHPCQWGARISLGPSLSPGESGICVSELKFIRSGRK